MTKRNHCNAKIIAYIEEVMSSSLHIKKPYNRKELRSNYTVILLLFAYIKVKIIAIKNHSNFKCVRVGPG